MLHCPMRLNFPFTSVLTMSSHEVKTFLFMSAAGITMAANRGKLKVHVD
jgi:hypothetical protein